MTQLYHAQFPRLMAAPGPKCGHLQPRPGRISLYCVRARYHTGENHLHDVRPSAAYCDQHPADPLMKRLHCELAADHQAAGQQHQDSLTYAPETYVW